jgi:hypothetical protein
MTRDEQLKRLSELDQESDFYALQCDFRRAASVANEYAKLRKTLLAEGVPVPPSISAVRAGVA